MILSYAFSTIAFGYVVHFTVGLFSLVVVINQSRHLWRGGRSYWRARTLAIACFPIVFVAALYGARHPEIVLAAANDVARDDPFCIALQIRRRPVRSRQELTFFTMDKGHTSTNHAILLVDRNGQRQSYQWSYRKGRFVKGIRDYAVACIPKSSNFAAEFPRWTGARMKEQEFYFAATTLYCRGATILLSPINIFRSLRRPRTLNRGGGCRDGPMSVSTCEAELGSNQ